MLRRRTPLFVFAAVLLTAAGWLLTNFSSLPGAGAEQAATDLLLKHGCHTPANPRLQFLAIDNDSMNLDAHAEVKELFGLGVGNSLEEQALGKMSTHWPWPRSVYALILERLVNAGAKVVAFDLNFPTPSEDDAVFQEALERHRDHVVIGSNFVPAEKGGTGASATLTPPSATLLPRTGRADDRIGMVNFWPDDDGVIRSARFRLRFSDLLGGPPRAEEPEHFSLAAQVVRKYGLGAQVPADFREHLFRLTDLPGRGFPARSVFEIFVPEYWRRNYQSGAVFQDAIVVVGAAGNWQHDEHQTAAGVMAGPEVQLNVINALLQQRLMARAPWWLALFTWVAAAVGAVVISVQFGAPLLRLGLMLLAAGILLGAAFLLANEAGRIVPLAGPLFVLAGTAIFSVTYDLVRSVAEGRRLRRHLAERKRAQELLQSTNEELERRVEERTSALRQANDSLTSLVTEKDVLLKEIHHRVKNNLQIISSLLNLQSHYIKDPAALQVFTESRYRVRSMALLHEKLYQSHDLARIDFGDYIRSLTSGLHGTFSARSTPVQISVEIEETMLRLDAALPCGLIVNELVTNCFKYAFPPGTPGEIRITLEHLPEQRLRLQVADNGVGFPAGLDFRNTESLGMQIVTTLAEQIEGTIDLLPGPGATFALEFPGENGADE